MRKWIIGLVMALVSISALADAGPMLGDGYIALNAVMNVKLAEDGKMVNQTVRGLLVLNGGSSTFIITEKGNYDISNVDVEYDALAEPVELYANHDRIIGYRALIGATVEFEGVEAVLAGPGLTVARYNKDEELVSQRSSLTLRGSVISVEGVFGYGNVTLVYNQALSKKLNAAEDQEEVVEELARVIARRARIRSAEDKDELESDLENEAEIFEH